MSGSGNPPDTVRDVEQRALIDSSKRLRGQLSAAVEELDRYVLALQTEIDRLQHKG